MNRLKAWIRSLFGFSRTETNGFLILLPMCLIIVFIEPIYQAWFTNIPRDNSTDVALLDSITSKWTFPKSNDTVAVVSTELKKFKFDPNTISSSELVELGFNMNIAERIINFRAKGGKFRIKADLKKIYRIDTSLVIALYPFCLLPETKGEFKRPQVNLEKQPKRKSIEIFDVNLADTTSLIKLRGIGSKLAQRIIKYRERLGGFVSTKQFKEVYGLDTVAVTELSTATYISNNFKPRQININTATEKELTSLPYIKFSIAKAIVAYRYQHKQFASVDDLTNITVLEETLFQKIKPYLTVKE